MNDNKQVYDTMIIGGGQAGLASGYYLQQQGRDFVILDAGRRVGDAWRQRWDSLRLFSPARYDRLPGMPFPAPGDYFPTKDEMADYLETYAAHFELPLRTAVRVDHLSKHNGRFLATAGQRRYSADNVIVATGPYQRPRIPAFAGDLDPAIVQLHSSQYRNPGQLQDGVVLVVGAANSGAEIALELSHDHRVYLSGRNPGSEPTRPGSKIDRLLTPILWFLFSRVLTLDTPPGRKVAAQLRGHGLPLARVKPADLLDAGILRSEARTVGVKDGLPLLQDGRVLNVRNVVWCTGFRPDYGWIDLPVFNSDGEPIHERGVVASEPGLYFVGLFFQYAAASALVGGAGRDAQYVVQHIAARRSVPQPDAARHQLYAAPQRNH